MATVLHIIKARLYRNLLTPDPDDYLIRANSERTLSIRNICESAVSRGGADSLLKEPRTATFDKTLTVK